MWLIQKDKQIVCSCGNDIFISMGDSFGFTTVECKECGNRNSIVDSSLNAEKLLSAYGEDYCKIFGAVIYIGSFFEDSVVLVDYLIFTEFETRIVLSTENRKHKISLAIQKALKNQSFETAARLVKEKKVIDCVLLQQKYFLML